MLIIMRDSVHILHIIRLHTAIERLCQYPTYHQTTHNCRETLSISYMYWSNTELFEADISRVPDICAPLYTCTQPRGKHDCDFLSKEARTAKSTCHRRERHFWWTRKPSDKQTFVHGRTIINESRDHVRGKLIIN